MLKTILRYTARVIVTLIVFAVAIFAARYLWREYMEKPWTRDGRIRALVVNIAPDVSGIVTQMSLKDNQTIHKGDVLFTIDPERYKLALEQANLAVVTARQNIKTAEDNVKTVQDNAAYQHRELLRHRSLRTTGASTQEELERAENAVTIVENALVAARNAVANAESAHLQALAAAATAQLNLDRTVVRSPVNGSIANLQLDVGNYAAAGKPMLAVINADSLYVAGYFEETKLRYIREGAPVIIKLMGYDAPVSGRVESIAPAVADRENTLSNDLVANVNPTFSWVRLAQRIPVRIVIDKVPEGVRLTAGMTATIIIDEKMTAKPTP